MSRSYRKYFEYGPAVIRISTIWEGMGTSNYNTAVSFEQNKSLSNDYNEMDNKYHERSYYLARATDLLLRSPPRPA